MAEAEASVEPELPAVSRGWEDAAVTEGALELTLTDFSSAVPYLPGFKRPWLLPIIGLGSLLVLNLTSVVSLSTLLPAVFGLALFSYFLVLNRKAWAKRAFANLGGGVTRFRFDDYGLSVESSLRQHRLAWASLARQLETPDSFVIFTTPQTLFVIPKRAFGAGQVVSIRELLSSRVVPPPNQRATGSRRMLLAWVLLIVTFLSIWHFLSVDDAPRGPRHKTHQVQTE